MKIFLHSPSGPARRLLLILGPVLLLALAGCQGLAAPVVQATFVDKVDTNLVNRPMWSPKGDLIAVAEHNKISLYDTSRAGTPRLEKTIEMPKTVRVDWSPDGRRLLAETRTSGRAFNRVVIVNTNSGRSRRLDFEGQDFFWLGPEKIAAYTNWAYRSRPFAGLSYTQRWISFSLKDGRRKPLALNIGSGLFDSRVGDLVIVMEAGGYQANKVVLYNLKTERRQRFSKKVLEISLAANGKAVVLDEGGKANDEDAFKRVFAATWGSAGLKLGKPLRLVDEEGRLMQVQGLSISPNGKYIAFKDLNSLSGRLYIAPGD